GEVLEEHPRRHEGALAVFVRDGTVPARDRLDVAVPNRRSVGVAHAVLEEDLDGDRQSRHVRDATVGEGGEAVIRNPGNELRRGAEGIRACHQNPIFAPGDGARSRPRTGGSRAFSAVISWRLAVPRRYSCGLIRRLRGLPLVASSQKTDIRPEHQLYHSYTTEVDQTRTNVHYEQPPEFFLLITGGEWNVYSANLWDPGTEDDTASQQAKLDLIARLAGLEKGMRLIDVGCGWAGPLTYLCDTYGLTGT